MTRDDDLFCLFAAHSNHKTQTRHVEVKILSVQFNTWHNDISSLISQVLRKVQASNHETKSINQNEIVLRPALVTFHRRSYLVLS